MATSVSRCSTRAGGTAGAGRLDGSATELEYQLLLAHDLEYFGLDAHAGLNEQVAEGQTYAVPLHAVAELDRLTADS
jgi:hypothetical protein